MSSPRKTALVAGVSFIVTFVASVPGPSALYHAGLHDSRCIVTGSGGTSVF